MSEAATFTAIGIIEALKAQAMQALGTRHHIPFAERPSCGRVVVTAIRPARRLSPIVRGPRFQFWVDGRCVSEAVAFAAIAKAEG